jgi:superfamily I DNA/RNA helicase
MNLTPQQQTILDHILVTPGLTMIEAKAGTGKTFMLTEISNALNVTNALYICFNKSVATEASHKFPKSVHCCTTHSLAFKPTVTEHKLKLGTFTSKSISELSTYDHRQEVVDIFRQFCLSSYTSFSDFSTDNSLAPHLAPLVEKYFKLMETAKIECTHEFYLKYFHLLLAAGAITYPTFDLVMLDEAGDLNEVTLEIFKLLPATRKVMVGDPYQNIYTFNHTINCFELMADQGSIFPMSQSFRVADHIATRIESFGRKYLSPSFSFEGVPVKSSTITTRAFIARTNAALIAKMMDLNSDGIPYGLTRKAKQIFELPLAFCALRYQGFIPLPEYKWLQADVDHYFEDTHLRSEYGSLFNYLRNIHSDDLTLVKTINLIQRYGKASIISCYEEARKHERSCQSLTLGTCHSCKGLEFDEVEIADDLNEAIIDPINILTLKPTATLATEHLAELYLYYVACSRAKFKLINATHL